MCETQLIRPLTGGDAEYLRDESKQTGHAVSISFPETEAQVRQVMEETARQGLAVTLQGSRTGLAAAAVPFGGHVLNLSRMDKICGMRQEGERFFVTLQPGVILQKLNRAIAARQMDTTGWSEQSLAAYAAFCRAPAQMFTPDPTESTASIGGMVSCNASGARSYRYGAARSHVTAVRGVLADGDTLSLRRGQVFAKGYDLTVTTDGGRIISVRLPQYCMPNCKNASGYYCAPDMDALDLLIGSDGTLLAITEIEIALLPAPAVTWGVTCFFETQQQAVTYTHGVRQLPQQPAAIEYFDPESLNVLRRQKAQHTAFAALPDMDDAYGCAVYTELHCDTEAQAYDLLAQLQRCAETSGGSGHHSWVACSDSDRDLLYFFRHAVPESVNMQVERYKQHHPGITKTAADIAVPDGCFEDMLALYDGALEQAGLQHAAWGHIGDNHIHVNILPRDPAELDAGRALVAQWAAQASAMGGAVSAEHGVGKLKAPLLELMYGKEQVQAMAAVKAAFDPGWRLGRGNLFPTEKEVPVCE